MLIPHILNKMFMIIWTSKAHMLKIISGPYCGSSDYLQWSESITFGFNEQIPILKFHNIL